MAYDDLQQFIAALDDAGELKRISVEVDPELEISEIVDRCCKSEPRGPALLFEKVKGSEIPLLINALGSYRRMCLALGVGSFDDLADRLQQLIKPEIPTTLIEKLKKLPQLGQIASFAPKLQRDGLCQQVIKRGQDINLNELPIIKCWPEDAGRFITLGQVHTVDPKTSQRNAGLYRLQVIDKQTCAIHWQLHHDGARHHRQYVELNQEMPMAVVLGADPTLTYAASAPLPEALDELFFSGFIRQQSVPLVQCASVDLQVPADAEVVIEGTVQPDETILEGPFGDHTGYYSLADQYPVFHVTAVTHRQNPVYPTTIVGYPPMEDEWIGKATERIFLPLLKMFIPEAVDYNLPVWGVFHNFCFISIKKAWPYHARKVMNAVWGLGQMSLCKFVVVVDEDIDVQKPEHVWFEVGANVDPKRDIVIMPGITDVLDHAAAVTGVGSKIGIDATRKWKSEGAGHDWPKKIVMDDETKALVDRRWQEYGFLG